MEEVMSKKQKTIYIAFCIVVVIMVYILGRLFIIGGISLSNLDKSSQIRSAIILDEKDSTKPEINDVHYFSDNTWAVVSISSNNNPAFVVLRKDGDFWRIFLGPGTNFSNTETSSVPFEVISYLDSIGVVDE